MLRGSNIMRTTLGSVEMTRDEEAFNWATTSLGEARQSGRESTVALLEAVVEELAFELGAKAFPPADARAARVSHRCDDGAPHP